VILADRDTLVVGGTECLDNWFEGALLDMHGPAGLRAWSLRTKKPVRTHVHAGSTLGLSADGRLLAIGGARAGCYLNSSKEGPVIYSSGDSLVVDAVTGHVRLELPRQGGGAAVCTDGKFVATVTGLDFHASAKTPQRDPEAPPGADRLRLWELATGEEVLRFEDDQPRIVRFTRDDRRLVSGNRAGDITLWETTPPDLPTSPLDRATLEGLWRDLDSEHALLAYRALATLATSRDCVEFLAAKLHPARADDVELRGLIRDLDAERYVVRRAAYRTLARRGAEARLVLEGALADKPPAPVAEKIRELLREPGIRQFPSPLRRQRAASALDRIGTPEARRLRERAPALGEP
jgi:hypothetical protein